MRMLCGSSYFSNLHLLTFSLLIGLYLGVDHIPYLLLLKWLNGTCPASFCLFTFFSNTNFTEKNSRRQRDTNSDRRTDGKHTDHLTTVTAQCNIRHVKQFHFSADAQFENNRSGFLRQVLPGFDVEFSCISTRFLSQLSLLPTRYNRILLNPPTLSRS